MSYRAKGRVRQRRMNLRSGPSALLGVTLSLLALSVSNGSKGGAQRRTRGSGDARSASQAMAPTSGRRYGFPAGPLRAMRARMSNAR